MTIFTDYHARNASDKYENMGTSLIEAKIEETLATRFEQPTVTPQLAKNKKMIIARAELFRLTGKPDTAIWFLMEAIKQGQWKKSSLWWRLVAMMTEPKHYIDIRDFWLQSPPVCHASPSIMRAIARAAAVSGHHDECRVLLRKIILQLAAAHRPVSAPRRAMHALRSMTHARAQNHASTNTNASDFASQAAAALADLNEAFSAIGLKAFLISGTLLGQVREGKIIGWDKDIDVGYFREDCRIDLESHFTESSNFRLGRVDFTSDRLRLIHKNGTWIDVFPHYMENGRRWHNGTATRWWNTPFDLSTVNFIGIDQYIPDNPERYLDENYGDWRTPNAHFDARIDAPNAEISDPEHFVSLLYFSLEKSIRANKPFMKQRYIDLLREHGEGAWLDRI